MRPCAYCDEDFTPANRGQKCCSPRCGQLLRQAMRRRQPDYQPPKPTGWKHPESTTARGLGGTHQRLRKQLLPLAIGQPCPLCGHIMHAHQRLALDHLGFPQHREGFVMPLPVGQR